MRRIAGAILILGLLPFWIGSSYAQQVMVLQGGTLIDGNSGPPRENAAIIIEKDRIKEIRTAELGQLPADARVIDVRGKFIIPGLQDAHVHYRDWMPPLFINNGVTTIHDIGTNPTEWILAQREMFQKEKMIGPRFYASVLNLWGRRRDSGSTNGRIMFDTPEEAKQWAEKAVELKADYIKIHEGFTGEMLIAIAQVAKENNLSILGHVPPALDAFQAAQRGQTFLEHSTGVGRAITKDREEIRRLKTEWQMAVEGRPGNAHEGDFVDFYTVDPVKEEELIKVLVARNVFLEAEWVAPAKNITKRKKDWAFEDLVFLSNPQLSFLPLGDRLTWLDYSWWDSIPDDLKAKVTRGFENWQKFMVKFTAAGGKVVTGTAAPNAIPGLGVHRTMQLLVDAGLTPMKAIQAATKNIAEMTRKQADVGTIEKGRYADLLVLDANPLEDISNTQKIVHVMKGGKIIERRYSADFRNPMPTTETQSQTNNVNSQPVLIGLEPAVAAEGDSDTICNIKGEGFAIGSVAYINGLPVRTTYKSRQLLEVMLPKGALLKTGTFPVQVFNPEPLPPIENAGQSNKVMFLVKFR